MSYILYTDFLKQVLPFTPDVPDLVAIHAVRSAAIDFCEQSHVYVYEAEPLELIEGENTYEVDLPLDTTIVALREVYLNAVAIHPITPDQFQRTPGGIDWRTLTGTPQGYTHLEPDSVVLFPMPDATATGEIKAIVTLKPTRSSTRIESSMLERWGEIIGMGARARLYEFPGIYQDDQKSADCWRRFYSGIAEAKRTANKGHTRANLSVQMPRII